MRYLPLRFVFNNSEEWFYNGTKFLYVSLKPSTWTNCKIIDISIQDTVKA